MKTPEEKKAEEWVCDHLGQEAFEEDCTLDCQLKIAYLAGRNAGIEEAADEIEAMSYEVTPNMGSANGAFVKAGIVSWLRTQVKTEDKP